MELFQMENSWVFLLLLLVVAFLYAAVGHGGANGFFLGLIGRGGGIILSPVILLVKWEDMKEAAAVSALFIGVNTVAGIRGQLSNGVKIDPQSFVLVGIAIAGGFLGGYFESKKMNNKGLRYTLVFVLFIASTKLFFT